MAIKLILIDIDNTLLDFDAFVIKFINDFFKGEGSEIYQAFCEVNDFLWGKLEKGELTFEQIKEVRWKMILERTGHSELDGVAMEEQFRKQMRETAISVPGAKQMIVSLAKKYVLCTASNGPYEQQIHRLRLAGFDTYFKMHFISEDIGFSKPDVRFFEEAFHRMQTDETLLFAKDEILMLGDSLTSDMQGGRNAGIHTCYFTREKKHTKPLDADIVVDCLQDVEKAIRGI